MLRIRRTHSSFETGTVQTWLDDPVQRRWYNPIWEKSREEVEAVPRYRNQELLSIIRELQNTDYRKRVWDACPMYQYDIIDDEYYWEVEVLIDGEFFPLRQSPDHEPYRFDTEREAYHTARTCCPDGGTRPVRRSV